MNDGSKSLSSRRTFWHIICHAASKDAVAIDKVSLFSYFQYCIFCILKSIKKYGNKTISNSYVLAVGLRLIPPHTYTYLFFLDATPNPSKGTWVKSGMLVSLHTLPSGRTSDTVFK